jgi:hypothetical protein
MDRLFDSFVQESSLSRLPAYCTACNVAPFGVVYVLVKGEMAVKGFVQSISNQVAGLAGGCLVRTAPLFVV